MRSRHLILPTLGLIANLRGRAFIFMAEVPFATFPLFWYFAVSYVVDRANLLSQLEPAPPTCGLVMRFVMTFIIPLIVPCHFAIGIIAFAAAVGVDGVSQYDFDDPKLITYIVFAVLITTFELAEVFVVQRSLALRRGLMSPWKVIVAGFANEDLFAFSSAAEPFRLVDVRLDDVDVDALDVASLFSPPVLRTLPDGGTEGTPLNKDLNTLQVSRSGANMYVTASRSAAEAGTRLHGVQTGGGGPVLERL